MCHAYAETLYSLVWKMWRNAMKYQENPECKYSIAYLGGLARKIFRYAKREGAVTVHWKAGKK